jgi:hypothetical protein
MDEMVRHARQDVLEAEDILYQQRGLETAAARTLVVCIERRETAEKQLWRAHEKLRNLVRKP